jgi:nicotinamidase/pyrazinamidase
MLEGPLVFFDIDTQRDFFGPDGALVVPGAEAVLPNLARLTAYARTHGIPVLATACAHALDDPDPEPFPPHCLIGTPGEERVAATAWPGGIVVPRDARHTGTIPPHLTVQKLHYNVFTHPDFERILALYNRDRPWFVAYGVATDYCVRANVEGLLHHGCRVALVVDAVRAVDPSVEPAILTDFACRGVLLTLTDVLCAAS